MDEKYINWAEEVRRIYMALLDKGFTSEQAIELMKAAISGGNG